MSTIEETTIRDPLLGITVDMETAAFIRSVAGKSRTAVTLSRSRIRLTGLDQKRDDHFSATAGLRLGTTPNFLSRIANNMSAVPSGVR